MTTTRPIIPCLWFDDQGSEAAEFYTSLFRESGILSTTHYGKEGFEVHGRPEGSIMTASFRLAGQELLALNGGPRFKFTPAVSFFISCRTEAEVDALWDALDAGGAVLMELGRYDWSDKYGWLADRYGLSWQIALGQSASAGQKITPALLFTGAQCGRAGAAMERYVATFEGARVDEIQHTDSGDGTLDGLVRYARFTLAGHDFMAMDSAAPYDSTFNEAVSFQVMCDSQAEIDYYWEELGEGGEPGQCGWLRDEFGVSWQVVPTALPRLLGGSDAERAAWVMKAFLQMKKCAIAELQRAYEG